MCVLKKGMVFKMNENKIYKKIESVMINQGLIKKDDVIDREADLFEVYSINSIKAIQLLVELENSFDIIFEEDALLPYNYRNINTLIETIKRHLNKG